MLTGLKEVQLSNNGLFGTLPPSWFWDDKATVKTWQTSLEIFHAQNNSFTGGIPGDFGMASNLVRLDLQQNRLRQIPTELGLMTSLTYLGLNDNILAGTLGTEFGLMTSMMVLTLYSNSLSNGIPSEMGQMTSMEVMWLNDNLLSGSIPSELGLLTNLDSLNLSGNTLLVEEVPSEICQGDGGSFWSGGYVELDFGFCSSKEECCA